MKAVSLTKIDKLVEKRTENTDYGNVCSSCTIYVVLVVIFLIISIGISCTFVYFYWYLKQDNVSITNVNSNTEVATYSTHN